MKSYEHYVRSQLTREQNLKLDNIVSQLGKTYFNDGTFTWMIDDFSNVNERIKVETPFLISQLDLNSDSKVFDACLGSGATSIGLLLKGIEVISNDLDEDFIRFAIQKANTYNLSLNTKQYDWRGPELKQDYAGAFDAIICTGNSLTYIMQPDIQQHVIDNFVSMLSPEGKLAVDTRNYTELLRGNFRNSGSGPYKGFDKVSVDPLYVARDMTLFRYTHKEKNISGDLLLYPFKDGEMEYLMQTAGLKDVKIYGDYKEKFNPKNVDFYTLIGTKT